VTGKKSKEKEINDISEKNDSKEIGNKEDLAEIQLITISQIQLYTA
jgi:hypothetical protein